MKSVFKSNKILIMFITILSLISAIIALLMVKDSMKSYTITTEYQDKFLVKERVTKKYPDFYYDFELYDTNNNGNNKLILKLTSVKKLEKEIISLYKNNNLRCYIVSNYIIFKINEKDSFRKIRIDELKNLNIEDYKLLVPAVKQLFLQNWEYAYNAAEFLVKCDDIETINILKRYENGNFDENELRINKYSIYSKNDIKKYSTSLLLKYNKIS